MRCTEAFLNVESQPLSTYTAAFDAYGGCRSSFSHAINRICAYLNRLYADRDRGRGKLNVYSMAMEVWRDVLLRRYLIRIVDGDAQEGHASPDNDFAVLLDNAQKMFFDRTHPNEPVLPDFTTLEEVQQRLLAEPVRYEPCVPQSWWTKENHHLSMDATREAVRTLLLIRQRFAVSPKADRAASLPQNCLLHTWDEIAKFLPCSYDCTTR